MAYTAYAFTEAAPPGGPSPSDSTKGAASPPMSPMAARAESPRRAASQKESAVTMIVAAIAVSQVKTSNT